MNYKLSSEGLLDIPFDKYEKDFTFIVNNEEIKTSRVIADFFSPIIRRSHYYDISNNTFYIKFSKIQDQDQNQNQNPSKTVQDYFRQFLQLINFSENSISSTEQKYYIHFFYELGNIDEYFRLQPNYLNEVTTSNVISRLKELTIDKTEEQLNFICKSEIYKELIKFISKNFESIEKDEMKQLRSNELESIIRHDEMILRNEDELFKFVLELYKEDQSKSFLFDFVIFSNLSQESIDEFAKFFKRENLDEEIWRSICSIISSDEKGSVKKGEEADVKTFEYESSNRFNGILKFLSSESNGNVLDNGK